MRVIFSGGTADLSAIQSVSVGESDGKVKILVVHHETGGSEKINFINLRSKIHYNPDVEMTKGFAEEIVKDIENLTKNPDMPIEQVIELKVWVTGHLQVNLKTTTDVQAIIALAELCWGWLFGSNKAPSDRQLELRTGLDPRTITRLTSKDSYKVYVEELMSNDFHGEGRTREEFWAWIKGYGDMPAQFGKRMRLSEDDISGIMLRAYNRNKNISCLCIEFIDKDLDEQYIYEHVIALLKDNNIESEVRWNDIPTNDRLIALYSVKIQKDPNSDDEHFVEYFGEDIIPEDEIFKIVDRNEACLCIWLANDYYYAWRYVVGFLEDEIIEAEVYWYNEPTNRRLIPKQPYKLHIS